LGFGLCALGFGLCALGFGLCASYGVVDHGREPRHELRCVEQRRTTVVEADAAVLDGEIELENMRGPAPTLREDRFVAASAGLRQPPAEEPASWNVEREVFGDAELGESFDVVGEVLARAAGDVNLEGEVEPAALFAQDPAGRWIGCR
jgi:hypothetical protein